MSRKLIIAAIIANEIRGVFSAAVMTKDLNANDWQMTSTLWIEAGILVAIGIAAIAIKKRYRAKA